MAKTKEFIAILDDEKDYANMLVNTLQKRDDSRLYIAANSPKELDALTKTMVDQGYKPAGFVLDVNMELASKDDLQIIVENEIVGLETGVQVGKHLKKMYADAKVILHTGKANVQDYQEALNDSNKSVDAVTVKNNSDSMEVLFSTLDNVLEQRSRLIAHNYGSGRGDTVFQTGGAGFVAGKELHNIVEDGSIKQTFVPIRAKTDKKGTVIIPYEERAQQLREKFDSTYRGKIITLNWDLLESVNKLKELNPEEYKQLLDAKRVEIKHNAAILEFVSDASTVIPVYEGNLISFSNVLTLAEVLQHNGNLASFIYRSTAYVSGSEYTRDLSETEQLRPVDFLNFYENTKLIQEDMLRNANIPYRIERLGIVSGDLEGKTYTHDTIYGVLEMLYRIAAKHYKKAAPEDKLQLSVVGDSEATNNFITVTDVLSMTELIRAADPDMKGEIYHITHPQNTPNAAFIDGFAKLLNFSYQFVSNLPPDATGAEKMLNEKMLGPRFDTYLAKRDVQRGQDNIRRLPGGTELLNAMQSMNADTFRLLGEHYLKGEHDVELKDGVVQY